MALTEISSPTVYINNARPIILVPTRPIIFWLYCTGIQIALVEHHTIFDKQKQAHESQ